MVDDSALAQRASRRHRRGRGGASGLVRREIQLCASNVSRGGSWDRLGGGGHLGRLARRRLGPVARCSDGIGATHAGMAACPSVQNAWPSRRPVDVDRCPGTRIRGRKPSPAVERRWSTVRSIVRPSSVRIKSGAILRSSPLNLMRSTFEVMSDRFRLSGRTLPTTCGCVHSSRSHLVHLEARRTQLGVRLDLLSKTFRWSTTANPSALHSHRDGAYHPSEAA